MYAHELFNPLRALLTPRRAAIVAIVSIVVLLRAFWSTPPTVQWRGGSLPPNPEQPAPADNPAPEITGAAQPVAQFDIVVDDGLYPSERAALADDLQQALAYVSQRFGSGPSERFKASVVLEQGCGLHGIAYTDARAVQVFTCNDIDRARAVAIMAHEFVHQLEQDRYGPAHLSSDTILSEGAATWGAGQYWLGGQPDFRSYVREQRKSGMFYPLATDYNGRGIGAMNALYYEWASFVDYLVTTYGREQFDRVYVTGHGSFGTADYAGVYGKGLDVLEREWQAWLDQ
ncbi:MAG: hypothetical protein IPO81_27020 [Kouleothrix sp.]|nr:hypothetical protein [Kouleothrix sp.]